MSTLRTNTLSNVSGTASTAIENAINGSAKAWVNFNGTGTVAIRASHNVSSITDIAAGEYQVNFTTAMADANFCGFVNSSVDTTTFNALIGTPSETVVNSSFRFLLARNLAGGTLDALIVYAGVFR